MKITVKGTGIEYYTPNEIRLNLTFKISGKVYEEVLENGSNNVREFIEHVLLPHGFTKEDLKTRSFIVKEETKYNEDTKKYEFDGYSYNQQAMIKFDYDKERLSSFMVAISKIENPPYYHINFGLNNETECRRKVIDKAYYEAYEQALAIANAAGKELEECTKVDFKPFTDDYVSPSDIDASFARTMRFNMDKEASAVINNTFTPEDILVSETLYCMWIAE